MQNFGQLHETFKDVLTNAITEKDSKGKIIFKEYIKFLKSNPTLKTQFNIFEKLENKNYGKNDFDKAKLFVEECISILRKLDVNEVIKSNDKLVSYLKKQKIKLIENYDKEELHKHIHNLAFTETNVNTIDSIVESKIYVAKYSKKILTENSKTVEPYLNKIIGPVMVDKFNEKFKDKLSETEKKIFKTIIEGSENKKVELYNELLNECIDLVDVKLQEKCTIGEKDKFLQVKDKLLRYYKDYDSDNFTYTMSKIANLRDSLI